MATSNPQLMEFLRRKMLEMNYQPPMSPAVPFTPTLGPMVQRGAFGPEFPPPEPLPPSPSYRMPMPPATMAPQAPQMAQQEASSPALMELLRQRFQPSLPPPGLSLGPAMAPAPSAVSPQGWSIPQTPAVDYVGRGSFAPDPFIQERIAPSLPAPTAPVGQPGIALAESPPAPMPMAPQRSFAPRPPPTISDQSEQIALGLGSQPFTQAGAMQKLNSNDVGDIREGFEVQNRINQSINDRNAMRKGLFMGLRNISEGFGNMWNAPLVGEMKSGTAPPAPYIAEDLRLAEAQEYDKLKPEEAQALQAAGIAATPGMAWSRVRELIKPITYANVESGRQDRSEVNAKLRERGLDIQEESLGLREKTAARPPNQTVEMVGMLHKARKGIQHLRTNAQKLQDKFGPVLGRLNTIAEKVGWNDPEVTTLKAQTIQSLADFVLAVSGRQASDNERRMLADSMSNIYQNGQTFEALLQNFEERIDDTIESTLGAQEAVGRNVEGLREFTKKDSSAAADGDGWVVMTNPETGKKEEVDPRDVERARSEGWK